MEVAGSSEPLVTVCHTCTSKVEVAGSQETALLIVFTVVTSDLTTSLHSEAVKQCTVHSSVHIWEPPGGRKKPEIFLEILSLSC
jgi:hypothetical protein